MRSFDCVSVNYVASRHNVRITTTLITTQVLRGRIACATKGHVILTCERRQQRYNLSLNDLGAAATCRADFPMRKAGDCAGLGAFRRGRFQS